METLSRKFINFQRDRNVLSAFVVLRDTRAAADYQRLKEAHPELAQNMGSMVGKFHDQVFRVFDSYLESYDRHVDTFAKELKDTKYPMTSNEIASLCTALRNRYSEQMYKYMKELTGLDYEAEQANLAKAHSELIKEFIDMRDELSPPQFW